MNEVIFMKGICCSGKSTIVNELRKTTNVLSSDEWREKFPEKCINEKGKDIACTVIFDEAINLLKKGENVLIDSCNVSSKSIRRINNLIDKTNAHSSLNWVITHPDIWIKRAEKRVSHKQVFVSMDDVLSTRQKMYESLTYTSQYEFDEVNYIITDKSIPVEKIEEFKYFYIENIDLFLNDVKAFVHKGIELNIIQIAFPELMAIINYNQGNTHHSLTLDEHVFKVCSNLPKEEEWVWIGLLHDLGKVVEGIRTFNPETNNNTYRGHAGASTDIAICVLNRFGFNQEFIDNVVSVVNRHMYLPYEGSLSNKKIKALGNDLYEKLMIFREADMKGK